MKTIWLSGEGATFVVDIDDDGIITKTAPICWKWKGQHIVDLIKYFYIDTIEELDLTRYRRLYRTKSIYRA